MRSAGNISLLVRGVGLVATALPGALIAAPVPPAVLVPLRGDFFCMPCGGNSAARGDEKHEPHGETATAEWRLDSRTRDADGTERIVLALHTKVRAGHVTKEIFLVPGEPAEVSLPRGVRPESQAQVRRHGP